MLIVNRQANATDNESFAGAGANDRSVYAIDCPPDDIKSSLRRKIVRDAVMLNVGTIIGQVLAVVQSLLVMRVLDPTGYGTWLGLVVLLSYAGYAHFGVENGLGIRLPYYRGLEDTERELRVSDTSYAVWTLSAGVLSVAILLYAAFFTEPSLLRTGLLVVSAMVPLKQQVAFVERWLGSRAEFMRIILINVLLSILSFCLVVPLAYWLGIRGVMYGTLIASVLPFVMHVGWSGYRPMGHFDREMLWELMRVGFPLMLVSLSWVLVMSIDRMLVLALLGTTSLGYYGVTGLGGGFLYGILSKAGAAMSPHITETIGRSDGAPASLRGYLIQPTLILGTLALAGVSALVLVVPLVVQSYLPQFAPGLPAFYIFVPGFYFLGITMSAGNILSVILMSRERQRNLLYLQGSALLCEVLLCVLMVRHGGGLAGVALASTIAYAVYGLGIVYSASRYVLVESSERRAFLRAIAIPFLYAAAVIGSGLGLEAYVADGSLWRSGIVRTVAGVATIGPIIVWLDRRVGLRAELLTMIPPEWQRIIGARSQG
jgi:O-antigen/teichoic acid export membrane protein